MMGFNSDTHLPHLLVPEQSVSEDQFQRERTALLMPAWHCVAQTGELPKDGSFKTLNILGHPLILWRTRGEIRAYLNVCSHRHCLLTGAPVGTMPLLKCQYHGWEYDRDGGTRRIPDARSFRPLEPGTLGLRRYRVETVGQLVFVTLAAEPTPLAEQLDGLVFVSLSNECRPIEAFLDGNADFVSELFSSDWERILMVPQFLPANWKTLVENVLENYHLETVHRETFKSYPSADACFHEITPTWTSYTERNNSEHSELKGGADHVSRRLGVTPHPHYRHVIIFPHFVMARMGLFSWAQTILPVAPRQTLNFWQFFMLRGKLRSGGAIVAAKILRHWGEGFSKRRWRKMRRCCAGFRQGSIPQHTRMAD